MFCPQNETQLKEELSDKTCSPLHSLSNMPSFQAKREFNVIIGVLFSESVSLQDGKSIGTRTG